MKPVCESESSLLYHVHKLFGLKGGEVERVKGIEPSSRPWEGHILPLNHTRTERSVSWRFLFARQVLPVGFAPRRLRLANP